jgi:hypothetical protein
MAIAIFFALNGLAVAFLLYVLVNFWKEGHRSKNDSRASEAEDNWRDWADVAVITHPISSAAQGGLAVIPFPVTTTKFGVELEGGLPARKTRDFAAKRISTR